MCGDFMNILAFNWCSQDGVQSVMRMVKTLVNVIRWVVPIGLVVMTTLDIAKHIINPDDKEGGKKIMTRAIAAVIVFFVPLFIRLVLRLVDIGAGKNSNSLNSYSECWR